jgi:hypothetical protein
MRIQSVELIALPGAPAYQERIYLAKLETGEAVDLFQAHWDVHLPPDILIGMTVKEACRLRVQKMVDVASGVH